MSTLAWSLSGWASTAVAALLLLVVRRRDALRRERVARASHELRGPLQVAMLALHPLRAQAAPDAVDAVEIALRRAIVALADLDVAPEGRCAPGRIGPVDVAAVVRREAEAWRALARGQGRELRLRGTAAPCVVHGDARRLAQAAGTLVANALEHGDGPVVVRVREAPGGHVAIEVSDDGPGLAAPIAVLAAGARAGRGRRGRGLAIARDIAARHGGRLASAPSPRGARLVLELPALAGAAAGIAGGDGA